MLDALIAIKGSDFIIYFLIACTFTSLLLWAINRISDTSRRYEAPFPTKLHPYALALLRGGSKGVLETALFSLYQRKLLNFTGNSGKANYVHVDPEASVPSHPLDREIYYFAQPDKPLSQLFANKFFASSLNPAIATLEQELEQAHLYRHADEIKQLQKLQWLTWPILAVGALKMGFGITQDKPIAFLLVAWVGFFILFRGLKPAKISVLGREFLQSLPSRFGWLRHKLNDPAQMKGIDPAFAIAALGVGVLAGSVLFNEFQQNLAPIMDRSSNTELGLDLGDGDSSHDSDGGGSSGGDGGGGCGGCGGGD